MDGTELYPIGDVARRTGLSVSTIRFYADSDVVPPTSTTTAGYRLYDIAAIARLELVRTLRELGASLDEIKQVLADTTSLRELATTHLALVEDQARRLRARQAVLRTLVRQDDPIDQVALMHKLASMSDDDRDRLIDRFWDEVTDGLQVHPAFIELQRRWRPHLPADPTVEQLEAWIELADLVQDEDFRQTLREAYRQSFSSDRSRRITAPPTLDRIERHRRLLVEARTAHDAGLPADSAPAREIAERLAASAAEITEYARVEGLAGGTPRPGGREQHARFMGLLSRYGTLVATINGTLRRDPAGWAGVLEWVATASGDD